MKSLSPALQAHLDDGTTTLAWCWRITRPDGVALGFTDHDRMLAFDGTEFEPESGFAASATCRPWPESSPTIPHQSSGTVRREAGN